MSSLAKELHDMMHFLQSHIAMLHYSSPASTCSFGIQMIPSPSVTSSSDWQPNVPLNMATGLHLHHEAISHPARNVCGCSGMPSQGRSPTLLHCSSPASSCLHLCCSDREGSTAHRLQSQCGSFQTSTNSPFMSHSHGQGGPSLLGLSSAFSSFPVACQPPQDACSPCIPSMSSSQPLCSPVNSVYSHPPLSINTNLDVSHNQSQTPIHSSITPTGQAQYHTAFSSLSHLEVHTSMCAGHTAGKQSSINGPRQINPVGSSPVHYTQDQACPLLGQVIDRDCRASLLQERANNSNIQTVDVQPSLLDIDRIQSQH